MPYDSSGVFSRAANTTPTAGTTITVSMHEAEWNDLLTAMNNLPPKDVANVFTASQTIRSSDSGASVAHGLLIDRNSSTPAALDLMGRFGFTGRDSGGNTTTYATMDGAILDPTDTSEDGALFFGTMVGGSFTYVATIGPGYSSSNASDQGQGTISISGHYYSKVGLKTYINTAIPAGGTAGSGVMFSSTTNFGIFFGSGAPTLSAAQGSLYLRSDGSSSSTRMYVNSNGTTGWVAVITAS